MAKGKYQKWLTPDGHTLLEAWARDGLVDTQIAHNMGISPSTLYVWKKQFPEISETLSRGKEIVDVQVENDLLKKTHGYNAEVKKTFKLKKVYFDKEGRRCEEEHLETAVDEVHVPADTNAITWWLKNRRPDRWRERVDPSAPPNLEKQDDGFLTALDQKAADVWKPPEEGNADEKE